MRNLRETVGRNLDTLMKRTPHLATQDKLAQRSGVAPSTVGRVRRAEVDTTVDTLGALASAFGVPLTTFFAEDSTASEVVVARPKASIDDEARIRVELPLSTMSPMQLAVADTFSKIVGPRGLTDTECLALLNSWAERTGH